MKRRGFLINSAALILIIPLLLLVATYEDVSSLIVQSQSERTQVERTYDVVSFLNLEFQKAMELSGKRAVVSAVDYVAVTGRFIPLLYKANNTIADLIREGRSPSIIGYDTERVMAKQTLKVWLSNVTKILREQGYIITPSIDKLTQETEIHVAPLDAFRVVVKAKIPHVKITDTSGVVVYEGPIPSSGDYVYSIVNIENLEDPFYSAITGGRYQRSLRACEYAFPKLTPPFTVANGTGSGSGVVIGRFGTDLEYNSTHIIDNSTGYYITNLTINGVGVRTDAVVLNDGDIGVMVFGNGGSSGGGAGGSNWCSPLAYRINLTVQNQVGINLDDYQIPLLISTAKGFTTQILDFLFSNTQTSSDSDIFRKGAAIAIYDSNCNPVPFWIEYWDPTNEKALIWIRDTIPNATQKTYFLYFGDGTPTKGDGDQVFIFFDDFEDGVWNDKWIEVDETPTETNGYLGIDGGDSIIAVRTKDTIDYDGSFAVRFRMRGQRNGDWDSGIGMEDSSSAVLLFTDDYSGSTEGLAIHRAWWSDQSGVQERIEVTTYNTYEAQVLYSGLVGRYNMRFKDVLDDQANPLPRVNYDSGHSPRSFVLPLTYLYIVTDSERASRDTFYDYVFIRKHPDFGDLLDDPNFNGITFYWRTRNLNDVIESRPSNSGTSPSSITNASVYDLQPLRNCLLDNRYFAIEDGWSFFERLEGSNENHATYVALAHTMQDELNYKPAGGYYPIGLVSFMIPHSNYDVKLFNLMNTLGITVEEGQSSADYHFLRHYFKKGPKVDGYRVWGISHGSSSSLGNLDSVPFFLDLDTSKELLGTQGTCQLLYGYSCG